jgi:hypothetical protein
MVGPAARPRTALLVVSAWHEGARRELVARVTYTLDVTQPERITVTAAGVDEIDGVVRRWLEDVDASRQGGDAWVTEQ